MSSGRNRATRAVEALDLRKKDVVSHIPGILGIPIGGSKQVDVPNRAGYVYVRLRHSTNELIQAYNDQVSPVYGLPVLIKKDDLDPSRYVVAGRDLGVYQSWGNSPYLPRHGNTHSFYPGGGGDVVWVYGRQLMPLLVHPSGTFGSGGAMIEPSVYYQDGSWKYGGGTGTTDIVSLKPTNNTAKMVLVYLDGNSNPQLLAGSSFDATITGTAQILPFLPTLPAANSIPLAGVRLVSGTSYIAWDNIYDVRPWIVGDGNLSTGTSFYFASLGEAQAGVVDDKALSPATSPIIMPNGGLFRTDETSVGGTRGAGSVDLQRDRTSADQVASGTSSAILGGLNNKITQPYSVIGGGQDNSVLVGGGGWGTVGGGYLNTLHGGYVGAIPGGYQNYISGSNYASVLGGYANQIGASDSSVILGGSQNEIVKPYAQAGGYHSKSYLHGMVTHSSAFTISGYNQRIELLFYRYTQNNTTSELYLNGSSDRAVLPDNCTWTFYILVSARSTGSSESAGYSFEGTVKRNVGVASIAVVGSISKTVIGEDAAAWDCNVDVDTTNGSLRIQVDGENGKNIQWVADLRGVQAQLSA